MHAKPAPTVRATRSDALANREKLLAAAAAAVKDRGANVPMAEIAERAAVGIGTLYRHFPTRENLWSGLIQRSLEMVLRRARASAAEQRPAIESIAGFFEQTIIHRGELFILPYHGGPVVLDSRIEVLRLEIRKALGEILTRGRQDGSIRPDVTATDIIVTGATLAQPLPHLPDWDGVARRQAELFLAGLAATNEGRLQTLAQPQPGFEAGAIKPTSGP